VNLEDHKIIVDENGYTAAVAQSLHASGFIFTEKYCGKETANIATRMLLMDNDRTSQTRFSMFIPNST